MKYIFLILVFLVAISCHEDTVTNQYNYEDQLSVSLILRSNQIKQTAFITRVKPFEADPGPASFVDSVILNVDNRLFEWIPSDSMGYNQNCWQSVIDVRKCFNYYTDSLLVLAGKSYKLLASYKTKSIEGFTDVPGDFNIAVKGRTISWTKSENAYLYRITGVHLEGGNYIIERVTTDSSLTINEESFDPGPYRITVEALDKNFYDLSFDRTYAAGLSGAVGVFGSVTIKMIETELR